MGRGGSFLPTLKMCFVGKSEKLIFQPKMLNVKGHLQYILYQLSPGEPQDSWPAMLRSLHLQQVECHYLSPSPLACDVQSVGLTRETPNKGEE